MWLLIVSAIFQVIGISVYGAIGIGNYAHFKAGYSIIIASVALFFNCVCAILFFLDILKNEKNKETTF